MVERLDQPTDLGVGVLKHGRKGLLESAGQGPLIVTQVTPRQDSRITRGQHCVGGDHSEFALAGEPLVPDHVPTLIKPTSVLSHVIGGSVVWGMGGPEGQIHEEGTVRVNGAVVVEEADRLVDKVLAEVVALGRSGRRLYMVVVNGELRVELVGFATEKPVETAKPALEGPLVEWSGGRGGGHGGQVPLSDTVGSVTLVAQQFGDRGGVLSDVTPEMGEAAAHVGHRSHADRVVVSAREEAGPGR